MSLDFQNKVVWITGASSGIGCALAKKCHKLGASLIISGRNQALLEQLKAELNDPKTLVLAFDVREKDSHLEAVKAIESHFGRLDIAILNAGTSQFGELDSFADTFDVVIPVNLMGVVYGIDACLKVMLPRNSGQIVVVSSLVAFGGIPHVEAYCASKAAIKVMMEGLEAHLYGTNIHVTTIYPGFIQTPLTDGNQFKMPFLMSADRAAALMANAIIRQKSVFCFPWFFSTVVRWFNWLPHGIYVKCIARFGGVRKINQRS